MKRILYGISGIGNGHSNREIPIIEDLIRDCQVMIFAHDDSLQVMTNRFGENPNVTIVPVGLTFVVGSPTGLDFKATANADQNQKIESFKTSFEALNKIISEWGKIDLVISDYEPISAQYAYAYKVPLVTIDQQSKFLYGDLPEKLGGFTFKDEVARLSMFFPKADKRIACSFFNVKAREGAEDVMVVPPTIKKSIINLASKRATEKNEVNILVYISSAKNFPQTPIEIVRCFSEHKNTKFHLFVPKKDFEEFDRLKIENTYMYSHGTPGFAAIMAKANGIISTAGHSLLSEAMFLAIPVYAIPVEPYEQHINALMISSNDFGVADINLTSSKLSNFLINLEKFSLNIKNDTSKLNLGVGQEIILKYLRENFLKNKKRVSVFSPPFNGHLNILKEFIIENNKQFDFQLIITGWENIPTDLSGIDPKIIEVFEAKKLQETDPALWTFPRVEELLGDCLKAVKKFEPDLIIYDFFSIEGNLIGKILDIPYWCSIPAMIGSFNNRNYRDKKISDTNNLTALKNIADKWGIKIETEDVEMISDGFHLPGLINLIWSFPNITPSDFKNGRSANPFVFVGNLRGDNFEKTNFKNSKPLIYFSLGTVVMNNLWNQQEDTRRRLIDFVKKLTVLWKDKDYQIVFVTQGKKVLDEYPDNWWIYDNVDQVEILSRADVFITHGGSNGFHEAVMQKVPMITIPFFGDQLLVSERVQGLGLGLKVGGSKSIDTHEEKSFLNDRLTVEISQSVEKILHSSDFSKKYLYLDLKAYSINSLITGEIDTKEGDLLIGEETTQVVKSSKVQTNLDSALDFFICGESDLEKRSLKRIEFFATLYKAHILLGENEKLPKEILQILSQKNASNLNLQFYKHITGTWLPINIFDITNKFSINDHSKKEIVFGFNKTVVTSKSKIKIEAVREVVGDVAEIIGYDPQLPFDEQLVGIDEIVFSASERLKSAKINCPEADLYVSIVSGLKNNYHNFVDVGVVLTSNRLGKTSIAVSAPLNLPLSSTQKAKIRGLNKFTVGNILSEEMGNHIYDKDPHSLMTQGKQTRKELLIKAVREAIDRLCED
jgi:MGT family glycosyltransferase